MFVTSAACRAFCRRTAVYYEKTLFSDKFECGLRPGGARVPMVAGRGFGPERSFRIRCRCRVESAWGFRSSPRPPLMTRYLAGSRAGRIFAGESWHNGPGGTCYAALGMVVRKEQPAPWARLWRKRTNVPMNVQPPGIFPRRCSCESRRRIFWKAKKGSKRL